ncbi:MAG: autotransporter-associated beta strand repeat-containing protein [Verrucomicrobia bacterium]|nr:autotransporter-associated beta strand repeat-containing protein [Verrucomicrobiota bacterium]
MKTYSMKPTTVMLARLVSLLSIAFPTILHATVTAVGVDATAGANWRTAAALEADGQYGTLGYVVFGLNAANNVYSQPYYLNGGTSNAGVANTNNLVSLPAGIGITSADSNIGMWSGNGNFGTMQDPASGNALTAAPVLANSNGPKQFTITRATSTGYRITLMTASGDGEMTTYSPTVNDGSGAVGTSHKHTANGLAYHVFQISEGTSNIVINVDSTAQNRSLTGIAFDDYVGTTESPLAWVGATSAWDTTTTGNWIVVADSSAAVFSNFSPVQFDDTATGTTVDISSGDVTPGTVNFNNSTKDYTLQGVNGIAGGFSLTKAGSGSLTVLNTNSYSGTTIITGGTLQFGDGASGQDGAVAGNISNGGALAWNLFGNQTFSGVISGTGSLDKSGDGTLTLSSATSSYTGNITISGGKLLATGSTGGGNPTGGSLGNPMVARTITVNDGGTLSFGNNDILGNAGTIPAVALVINSGGTVTNNGNYFTALTSVTLNGGTLTAVGGVVPLFPSYSLKGTVTAGGSATSTISASGPNAAITVGTDTVTSVTFSVDTDSTLDVSALLTNGTNTGSLAKSGDGTLILGGDNTYGGTTTVHGGTLAINGTMASGTNAITATTGGTLAGTGTTNRPVVIASGGFLSPAGSSIGTLTTNRNVTFSSGATAVCQIDKTSGTLTQDLLDAGSATAVITYGGTLEITATGEALVAGDSFKIFNAASYAGAFTAYVTPTLPAGLYWDSSGLTSTGTVTVVDNTTPAPAPIFSPPGGAYIGAQSVTIWSGPGTTIHYTTDGSDPHTSGTVVTADSPVAGVVIPTDTASMILTAYASQSGRGGSAEVIAVYSTVTTPTWNVDGDGLWSDAAKWLHGLIPNATDITADFRTVAQSALTTVTLDSNRTVGTVLTGNANPYDWNLMTTNGSVLTLATSSGTPVIDVANQATTISTPVAGAMGFTKTGNGKLVLTGTNGYTGATTVTGGTLELGGGMIASTERTDVNNGATYLVSGGTKTGGLIDVNAGGTYTQTSGAVTCTSQFVIGAHGTSTGSISDGTLTVNAPFYIGGYGNGSGTGTFTQTGGSVVVTGGVNYNGAGPNNGIYNLNGGTLTASVLGRNQGTGAATFNFNGGVLLPTASNAGFMQGLTAAHVMVSGAMINTNSYIITIGQALLHDSALGTAPDGGLTKTGNGTLTLSGANTYSGNTTVNGGTLSLGQVNSNNESSTVSIAAVAGAKLDLAFVGTDTVGRLFINGVQQPAGDYTSADPSGAFTGGGTLHVTSDPGGYASWAATQGLTGTAGDGSNVDPAFNADPNKDGIQNGMAWILGADALGNPAANLLKLPAVSRDDGTGALVLTFDRLASSAANAPLVVQYGDDLGITPWTDFTVGTSGGTTTDSNGVAVHVAPGAGLTGADYDRITVTIPAGYLATHPKTFARLTANLTP